MNAGDLFICLILMGGFTTILWVLTDIKIELKRNNELQEKNKDA